MKLLLVSLMTVTLLGALASDAEPIRIGGPKQIDAWWQSTIVYQIYPRSYQDSDDDGTGDLKGIQSRLQHLVDLGVETIWLSPIYESPMADFGYDISNFTNVDPIFGNLDDFQELSVMAHGLGKYI